MCMRYADSIVVAPDERILHRGRLHWTVFVYPSSVLTLFILPLVRWFTCEAVVPPRRIIIASGWLSLPRSSGHLRYEGGWSPWIDESDESSRASTRPRWCSWCEPAARASARWPRSWT